MGVSARGILTAEGYTFHTVSGPMDIDEITQTYNRGLMRAAGVPDPMQEIIERLLKTRALVCQEMANAAARGEDIEGWLELLKFVNGALNEAVGVHVP